MNIGKKILSALIELPEEEQKSSAAPVTNGDAHTSIDVKAPVPSIPETEKFERHFEQLLNEANFPGPDYFEFQRMTAAMRAIGDEGARFQAAFAGLQAQGLDKTRLLESAAAYLKLLDEDAVRFRETVDTAQQEKVTARRAELEEARNRIEALSREIAALQQKTEALQREIAEQDARLQGNELAYNSVLANQQAAIRADIERITKHIQ